MMIQGWFKDDYEEEKKQQKKNCQAHVTVLRTCSKSGGGVSVGGMYSKDMINSFK